MKKRSFYKPNLQKWTEEQYALFRNALSENAGIFFDLLRMGVRKNEALALTPSDISPIGISINKAFGRDCPKKYCTVQLSASFVKKLQMLCLGKAIDEAIFQDFNPNYILIKHQQELGLPPIHIYSIVGEHRETF